MKLQEKTCTQSVVRSPWSVVLLLVLLLPIFSLHAKETPKSDWQYYQQSGQKNPKWDPLVEAGFGSFDSGNLNTALNFLERARALGCKDGLLLYKLALNQEFQGNSRDAIALLQQAQPSLQSRYPSHLATLTLSEHLGGLFYKLGKYDDALPQYLSAIQTQGENFLRLYLVAQIYRMKKDAPNAITYFEKALTQPITLSGVEGTLKRLAQVELLKLYFDNGADDKTLEIANKILDESPQDPIALSYRDEITHRKTKAKEDEVMKRIIEKQ